MEPLPLEPGRHLDADSDIPLYQQLYNHLRDMILSGELQPNHKLPSERILMTAYGISRTTVRQAYRMLVADKYIYARPGSGYYIAPLTVEKQQTLTSFSEALLRMGLVCTTRFTFMDTIRADATIAKHLSLQEGDRVHYIQRVRCIHKSPLGIQNAYLPYALNPRLLASDFSSGSLYQVLEEQHGIQIRNADETLQARMATPKEQELFDLEAPLPVLEVRRLAFDIHHQVIHYSIDVFRGDRYHPVFHLTRS
ncbi:MAG: GntR family transcriptional regulator [Anaerolineae bacterium]|nr:GntR family transcriptional regulator [Anaerolineae bacterium]